jgi:hypothetical protein
MMTAVGVAGGLVLGNALMSAFSGGGAAAAASSAGGFGQDAVPASSDWGAQPQDDAAAHDQGYGHDDAGAYDDGGGYDEEI